uniref:MotA/TolQ/ExbB proton channel family protein n=1 Tax=Candidatus Kentrum sp. DK TaxID=2126562 RepID=A0A450SSS9_9GAMM|nr:MAG: hypothetical protein BECKDK2373B_GA0170837_106320 [Candidatus Kentron sp. DK]
MKILRYIVLTGILSSGAIILYIDIASLLFKAAASSQSPESLSIANIFLKIIIAFFLVGFVQLILRQERLAAFAGSIPSYLTAIGILGTFVGIFVGLYKFDVSNLQQSVPLLLDGMKLAFSTSIAGLTSSTILRIGHSIAISVTEGPDPFVPVATSGAPQLMSLDDWFTTLVTLKKSAFDESLTRMESIRKASGAEELEELLNKLKDIQEKVQR